MATLRFHQNLYSAGAIEAAMKVFGDHGTFDLQTREPYFELSVEAAEPADEDALLGELSNYALALTIEEKREP